jgi:U4/U6.U5 tri-snRNP-associated protein 2
MSKRPAEEPLEAEPGTPVPKRTRFDGYGSATMYANGDSANGLPLRSKDEDQEDQHRPAQDDDEISLDSPADSDKDEMNDFSHQRAHRQVVPTEGYSDLYLDTIDRTVLDFDFEKLCSISLSNLNVYACLVCGKYFQGRGPKSHAYFHSLDQGHHVYINMETLKVYALPEGYEVQNASLDDIKYVVNPRYPKEEVSKLDRLQQAAFDLTGRRYVPGKSF